MYADIHINNLLLSLSLWPGEEYPQAWHKFAQSVITGEKGLLPLVLNEQQRGHLNEIGSAHANGGEAPHIWDTRRENALLVPKQAPRLLHIGRIPEFSLETVGDNAILAAAAACMNVDHPDYKERSRAFTAAVAEAFAYAEQASEATDVQRKSGFPAQMFIRLDAIRKDASDKAYKDMHSKLLRILLGEE